MGGEKSVEEQTLNEGAVGGAHQRRKELMPPGKDGETGILKIDEVKVSARA